MNLNNDTETLVDPVIEDETEVVALRELVLFNDDYHSFDFVINSLVEVCNHDVLQAEQCTHIIHYNGKCAVKNGTYDNLNPLRVALVDRGLSAVVE